MNARLTLVILLGSLLAGCGDDQFSDLRAWMASTGKGGAAKMEPLPKVKHVAAFEYNSAGLRDPFQPSNLRVTTKGGLQPDLDRPRQPLEQYPLDALHMVGTINRPGKPISAVIQDPKGALHIVRVGDRIGQNFGTILKITSNGVDIRELIQDGSGEWTASKANMTLTGEAAK